MNKRLNIIVSMLAVIMISLCITFYRLESQNRELINNQIISQIHFNDLKTEFFNREKNKISSGSLETNPITSSTKDCSFITKADLKVPIATYSYQDLSFSSELAPTLILAYNKETKILTMYDNGKPYSFQWNSKTKSFNRVSRKAK